MSEHNLRQRAKEVMARAYAPYSRFFVGACLVAEDETLYCGCNVENASFGGTVCAERVAIFNMVSGGRRRFSTLYVYTQEGSPPCGLCLQVMGEFASREARIIMGAMSGREKAVALGELLPMAFALGKAPALRS